MGTSDAASADSADLRTGTHLQTMSLTATISAVSSWSSAIDCQLLQLQMGLQKLLATASNVVPMTGQYSIPLQLIH